MLKARIVNIQRFSLHDGPGIRTTVFFKGCPLRCRWCANPECISPLPQPGFSRLLCNKCGDCFSACRERALVPDKEGMPAIDRSTCTSCGQCVNICSRKALVIYGREITLKDLYTEVGQDRMFYTHSGGGVTASGGEPLLQAEFVLALFELCRKGNIPTAIETSGHIGPEVLRRALDLTDFVFYDLKLMDTRRHLDLTGKPNDLILKNAQMLIGIDVPAQFRMPLIPGLNDDLENIRATAAFLQQLGKDSSLSIELMPYHRLGTGKYAALGEVFSLSRMESAGAEVVEIAQQRFEEQGITCKVSS